jgi:hypothetical protein
MSVNLEGAQGHSGGGKLSIARLKDGRFVGVFRVERNPRTIEIAFSDDGVNFTDRFQPVIANPWGKDVGDPAVVVFDIQDDKGHFIEHLFVFYEASCRLPGDDHLQWVTMNTAMMWYEAGAPVPDRQDVPLTESNDLPKWGFDYFKGTSVPTAIVDREHMHLWIFWSGLYENNPNHSEVGAGYIGIVRPGTDQFLPLEQGGRLEQRNDGWFRYTIDPLQMREPVLRCGSHQWCQGAVDIGNIVLGNDGKYYAVFVGGRLSENSDFDTYCCGLARTDRLPIFKNENVKSEPILVPHERGRHGGIQYPMLIYIDGSWYLYYTIASRNFDGKVPSSVPNSNECHARLKLQWTGR